MTNFILIFSNIFLVVTGQFLIKTGMNKIGSFQSMDFLSFLLKSFLSPFVLVGIFLYVCSTIIWLMLLSKVELSFAYPLLSISYILILLVSWLFLDETVGLMKVVGIIAICLGVILIFKS